MPAWSRIIGHWPAPLACHRISKPPTRRRDVSMARHLPPARLPGSPRGRRQRRKSGHRCGGHVAASDLFLLQSDNSGRSSDIGGRAVTSERCAARGGGQDRMASPARRAMTTPSRLLRRLHRDGGTAWDTFPEEWRRIARENARPALLAFRNSIGNYPSAAELANVAVPVQCSYVAPAAPTASSA